MATRPGNRAGTSRPAATSSQVSKPVLVLVLIVLVVFLGGLAYHFFGPQQGSGTGHVRALTADEQWMRQKARETGGDFSKLTQEDQRRMFSIAGPKAPYDFRQAARSVKIGP